MRIMPEGKKTVAFPEQSRRKQLMFCAWKIGNQTKKHTTEQCLVWFLPISRISFCIIHSPQIPSHSHNSRQFYFFQTIFFQLALEMTPLGATAFQNTHPGNHAKNNKIFRIGGKQKAHGHLSLGSSCGGRVGSRNSRDVLCETPLRPSSRVSPLQELHRKYTFCQEQRCFPEKALKWWSFCIELPTFFLKKYGSFCSFR